MKVHVLSMRFYTGGELNGKDACLESQGESVLVAPTSTLVRYSHNWRVPYSNL